MTTIRRLVWAAWVVAAVSGPARAQVPAPADEAGAPPVDPIRCWWRTGTGAVATGEPFDATLTCAVREDRDVTVVPDETRLGAAVVQLQPFEILGGTHPADLRTPTHRFFQYHYVLRIIDRDYIGRDALFPDLTVSYRIQTRVAGDRVEGRDRSYVLPGQPMRVLSLVPADAADIRDGGEQNFAQVESLRFRSRALRLGAVALATVGVLLLAPALARLGRRRADRSSDPARLPARAILGRARAALEAVNHERRHGWTPELAARAATAARLAAATALDRRTAQRALPGGTPAAEGQLTVRRGWIRPALVAVSAPVTAADVAAAIARLPATAPLWQRQALEALHQALVALTRALYRPAFDPDDPSLDSSLADALAATRQLARAHAWPRALWRGRGHPRVVAEVQP